MPCAILSCIMLNPALSPSTVAHVAVLLVLVIPFIALPPDEMFAVPPASAMPSGTAEPQSHDELPFYNGSRAFATNSKNVEVRF